MRSDPTTQTQTNWGFSAFLSNSKEIHEATGDGDDVAKSEAISGLDLKTTTMILKVTSARSHNGVDEAARVTTTNCAGETAAIVDGDVGSNEEGRWKSARAVAAKMRGGPVGFA